MKSPKKLTVNPIKPCEPHTLIVCATKITLLDASLREFSRLIENKYISKNKGDIVLHGTPRLHSHRAHITDQGFLIVIIATTEVSGAACRVFM